MMKENSEALTALALRLEPAVAVLAAVEVVRREGDETARRPAGRQNRCRPCRRASIVSRGTPLRPVLADHHRPPLARLDVLGHQQDAPGEHVRPDVQHHVVAGPLRRLEDLARAGVGAAAGARRSGPCTSLRKYSRNALGSSMNWSGGSRIVPAPSVVQLSSANSGSPCGGRTARARAPIGRTSRCTWASSSRDLPALPRRRIESLPPVGGATAGERSGARRPTARANGGQRLDGAPARRCSSFGAGPAQAAA